MIKLLLISGSPISGSSVEILLGKVAEGFQSSVGADRVSVEMARLNDLKIRPCQACGESPEPEFCIYDDGMTELYQKLIECDAVVVGTPIYFDSVSAQTKLFVDRCNCMRPGDFSEGMSGNRFVRLIEKKRPGGIVLVGSERGYYEGARRVIAGFYKWIEVINHGMVTYASADMRLIGSVAADQTALDEAFRLGQTLAGECRKDA